MRVLLVSHYFLPLHVAGVETYTYRLAKGLAAAGDEVRIYCREDGIAGGDIRQEDVCYDGLPVRRVYYGRFVDLRSSYHNPAFHDGFESLLRDWRPDVVHYQHLDRLSAGFIEVARALGLPQVLTLNDFWFICPQIQLLSGEELCSGPEDGTKCASCPSVVPAGLRTHLLETTYGRIGAVPGARLALRAAEATAPGVVRRWLNRGAYRKGRLAYGVSPEATQARRHYLHRVFGLVDVVLGPSRFLMDMFRRAGLDHPRFLYSDYGIPVAALRRARTPASRVRFGYFSAVVPHKGIELLIRSFRQISGDEGHLLVRGQGDEGYLNRVKGLAGDDPRITFLPPYRETEVAETFSGIDVLVVPSLWYENSPIVIHEAAAAGVPVVASDVGGMAEYVRPGRNGLLFRLGDDQDLRRQMERFLRDPGLSRRLTDIPFPIKTVEENVAELRDHYVRLLRGPWTSPTARVS